MGTNSRLRLIQDVDLEAGPNIEAGQLRVLDSSQTVTQASDISERDSDGQQCLMNQTKISLVGSCRLMLHISVELCNHLTVRAVV